MPSDTSITLFTAASTLGGKDTVAALIVTNAPWPSCRFAAASASMVASRLTLATPCDVYALPSLRGANCAQRVRNANPARHSKRKGHNLVTVPFTYKKPPSSLWRFSFYVILFCKIRCRQFPGIALFPYLNMTSSPAQS